MLAVSVATTLTLGVAGCGSGDKGGKTLTYWSMWKLGEPQQKVLATTIADFQQETGIKVRVQWQGRTNLQKLVPALNTNNVPDLVDGPYIKAFPALAASNQALGLNTAYANKADGKPVSELIPGKYLTNVNIKYPDGQPWMLPYHIQSDAIWFDAAKHPDIAANPPKTWDQWLAAMNKIKAAGQTPLAADGDIAGYNAGYFATLLLRSSGAGALKKLTKDPTGAGWDDPTVLDAAKKVQQLVKGGYLINGYAASKWPAQQQKWAAGKAVFMFIGSWLPTESAPYAAPGFKYSSFPFPSTGGSGDSVRADLSGFLVPKKAKNATTAQQFAAFFLRKKYQDAWGTQAKVVPIRSDAATSPEMTTVKAALDKATTYHQQNDGVAYPGFNEKVFWPKDDELFFGKITPEQFVKQMKSAQQAYWKEHKQ